MLPASQWNVTAHWDLTGLLTRILQVNGAPLFDVAVQVDDRNTSRYLVSIGLPRQSGVMPTFYSPIQKDLLNVLGKTIPAEASGGKRRNKRQFTHFADNPSDSRDETPETILETLHALPHDIAGGGLFLPDANFLSSIQQLSRDQKAAAAFRLMKDAGAFEAFGPDEIKADQSTILQLMTSVDLLAPSDRVIILF